MKELYNFFITSSHNFYISVKSVKHHNFKSSVPCISEILTTFNLYSGRPGINLYVKNKQRSDKQWLPFKEGSRFHTSPPPPPSLARICWTKWLDHRRVNPITYGILRFLQLRGGGLFGPDPENKVMVNGLI